MTRSLEKRPGVAAAAPRAPTAAEMANLDMFRAVVEEPRVGEWTNSTEWGENYSGPFPKAPGQVLSILTNNRIIGPPRQVLVALARPTLVRPEPANADVYALVTFGCGATSCALLMDWRGVVAVPANTITVGAFAYAPNPQANYDPTEPTALRLGVSIAVNGSAPSEAPTFTTPLFEVAAGFSVQLPVPAFARRFTPFVGQVSNPDPLALPDFVAEQWTRSDLMLSSFELSAELIARGLPIAGSADTIVLFNFSPHVVRMGAVFHLGV